MVSTKSNKLNSQATVYNLLLEKIFKGELKPGEVVTEVSLSEKFGMSRTPVREALKRLEMDGLIETEGRTKKIFYLSMDDIEEIFDLKIAIESEMAKIAASSENKKLKEQLGDVVISMNKLNEQARQTSDDELLKTWLKLDKEFHHILFQLAPNHRAQSIIDRLNIQWHRIKLGITAIEGRIEKAITEHSEIGNAVMDGDDAKAATKMRQHLASLKNFLLQLMRAFH